MTHTTESIQHPLGLDFESYMEGEQHKSWQQVGMAKACQNGSKMGEEIRVSYYLLHVSGVSYDTHWRLW